MFRSKQAIAVKHISYNLVESEISGVRTIVSVIIFYDIRKRQKPKEVVMSPEWFGRRPHRKL